MITIGRYTNEEILPHIGLGMPKLKLMTGDGPRIVKANSNRLECLKRDQTCVRCHRAGSIWLMQTSIQEPPKVPTNCFIEQCPWCALRRSTGRVGYETPHLNLYHQTSKGQMILMTQDHIHPKHAGGSNDNSNLQTMCSQCNSFKGGMLPDEYIHHMSEHERAIYSGRMAGRSLPSEGLQAIHLRSDNEAFAHDCAAE